MCSKIDLEPTNFAVTPFAHGYCMTCLRSSMEESPFCRTCRQPLKQKDVRPLVEDDEGESAEPQRRHRLTGYGTKLVVLVQKLHELRQQDESAKAILFVQFDDLKMQVAHALREGGIPTAQLKGSVSQRANIIRDWQENKESKTFVLLLSLAESASGTNLTAGNHVIFLHPMLATTLERAAAQELQAIGRARRHGQKRDTLQVWRFVTDGTVEKVMTEHHQETLLNHETQSQKRPVQDPEQTAKDLRKQRNKMLRSGIKC